MFDRIENEVKNIVSKELYNNLSVIKEARHLNNYKIIRNSDSKKGKIIRSRVHGNAYDIEWEDGSIQTLGRKTITNDKKYTLKRPKERIKQDDKIEEKGNSVKAPFGSNFDKEEREREREERERESRAKFGYVYDDEMRRKIQRKRRERERLSEEDDGMENLGLVDKMNDPILDDDLKEFNANYENNVSNLQEECKKIYNRMGGNGKIKVNYNKSRPDLYIISIFDKDFTDNKLQKMVNKLEGKYSIYDYDIVNNDDLKVIHINMDIKGEK